MHIVPELQKEIQQLLDLEELELLQLADLETGSSTLQGTPKTREQILEDIWKWAQDQRSLVCSSDRLRYLVEQHTAPVEVAAALIDILGGGRGFVAVSVLLAKYGVAQLCAECWHPPR